MRHYRTPQPTYLTHKEAREDEYACFDGLLDDYNYFVKCLPYNNQEYAWIVGGMRPNGLIEACFDRTIREFTEEQFVKASEIYYVSEDPTLIEKIIFG